MRNFPGLDSAKRKAEGYYRDVQKAVELVDQASIKAEKEKGRVNRFWHELSQLTGMIKAWAGGDYKKFPAKTVVMGLAALLYFVNPFDVVPDIILGLGFLDDATVIMLVFNSLRKDIAEFEKWQMENKEPVS